MHCADLLDQHRASILEQAFTTLDDAHHHHYKSAGEVFTRARLENLLDLVVTAIRGRDLSAVTDYATDIAGQRFTAGFDISEVQAAFNALEEAMWRHVTDLSAAADLAEFASLMTTVLGYGKDVLARTYVSLATRHRVRSLDMTALFAGTQARPTEIEHIA